ncbi:uncharacterized protein [Panulirus ornatus]|uniref:uncharacterized protein isoform X2 n=1 Tax=Panulirus ornatus TaxID=150431 RepID=UPI003A86FB80
MRRVCALVVVRVATLVRGERHSVREPGVENLSGLMDTTAPLKLEETLHSAAAATASPGMYNSTCGTFRPCYAQFNLRCLEGRCVCFPNYSPDTSGGCEDTLSHMMLNWIVRFTVVICLFFVCIMILHVTLRRHRCCEGRGSQGTVPEEGGSHRPRTCWHDDPPSYVEVVEPPPSYYEAVVKVGPRDELCPGVFKVPNREPNLEYPGGVSTARVETPAAVTCSEESRDVVTGSWLVVARPDLDSPENGRPRVSRSYREVYCQSNLPSPDSHTSLQLHM